MNARPLVLFALIAVGLAGCHKRAADAAFADNDEPGFLGLGSHHGRYGAVGIYTPGEPWWRIESAPGQGARGAAQLSDDQAIIVVNDSQTGEVRACGDMTGYCISMNPWKAQILGGQIAPIKLKPRAADESPPAPVRSVRVHNESYEIGGTKSAAAAADTVAHP